MLKQGNKRLSVVTDTKIQGFFGDYRFLSNFHGIPITLDGITYPTSEHAYMAEKTDSLAIRRVLADIVSPAQVKAYTRANISLSPDWDILRTAAMLRVLTAKFNPRTSAEHALLASLLLSTEDLILEESNDWGDTFWGTALQPDGSFKGCNMLGKTLMLVRDTLRASPDASSLIPVQRELF